MKYLAQCLALLALLVGSSAYADTLVSGTISANTTWTLANSPYVVTGTVTVAGGPPAPVLTIQAGVTVKFNANTALVVTSLGAIQAIGTSGSLIVFTANNGSTTPGYWRAVQIQGNGAASQITYATISYGGGASTLAGLDLQASNATIQNVTVKNSGNAGISNSSSGSPSLTSCTATLNPTGLVVGRGGQPNLQSLVLTGNAGYAMTIDPATTLGTVSAVTATSNGINSAQFSASNVDINTTWKSLGIPYVASSNINVGAAVVPILTISAGVTVQFGAAAQLRVGFTYVQAPGGLQATGTVGLPITLTSVGTVTAGAWPGVKFFPTSSSTSSMTYTTVSGGGSGSAGIYIDSVSPTLTNVTAQTNSVAGIWLTGPAAPMITNVTSSSNPVGLWAVAPAAPSLQGLSLLNNTGFAASLDGGVTLAAATGIVATGNLYNAAEIRSGTVGTSATWRPFGTCPYIVTGAVSVYRSSAPVATLTLSAGLTVRFRSNTSLVISSGGFTALQAVGTTAQPIVLTSDQATPTAGYWVGLTVNAAPATVSYVSVIGAGSVSIPRGAIEIDNASPSMDHVTVTTSTYAGINVVGGSPSLSNLTVSGAPWGVKLASCTAPSITTSTVSSNSVGGVWVGTPCGPLLQSLTLTGNIGYALSLDVNVSLGSGSSVTASGNTTNAIEMRSATVAQSTTWRSVGLPYMFAGSTAVTGAGTPVLTIEAGVTAKFASATTLSLGNSKLVAVGTVGSPIVFTPITGTSQGSWGGIRFSSSPAGSQLTYVTVQYGGPTAGSLGGIDLSASTVALDHMTLTANGYAGLSSTGSTPILSNSTVSGSPWGIRLDTCAAPTLSTSTVSGNTLGGVRIAAPCSPTLVNLAITGNTGYALSLDPGVTLGSGSVVTASGNTTNAAELRPGNAGTTTVWRKIGIPYLASGSVSVSGAGPPTLTVEAGTTVQFAPGTFLTVSGASFVAVGTSALPVTFTSSSGATQGLWGGIVLSGAVASQIQYATVQYAGNTAGMQGGLYLSLSAVSLDHVVLNTNAYAGITGGGPGAIIRNTSFLGNPAAVKDGNGAAGAGTDARLCWWENATGPSGIGPGTGESIATGVSFEPWLAGTPSTPEYLTNSDDLNRKFNPGSSDLATWNVSGAQSGTWSLAITTTVGGAVRTLPATGLTASIIWDGKNGSGVVQPDGQYLFSISLTATVGGAVATVAKGSAYVDSTLQVAITAPVQNAVLSNVYQVGTSVNLVGSASMSGFTGWTIDYGVGSSPSTWTTISSASTPVVNNTFTAWNTVLLPSGPYTLRLRVTDNVNSTVVRLRNVTIGNFTASESALQLNIANSEHVTYTSLIPFSLTESIVLKNKAGVVVRTLVNNVNRSAGTYLDVWDGLGDASVYLSDGPYWYIATVTDGTHNLTWDLTSQSIPNHFEYTYPTITAFQPYNNVPWPLIYNFTQAGVVSIAFYPGTPNSSCSAPNFCLLNTLQESGLHTVRWAGTDGNGYPRPDVSAISVVSDSAGFSPNATVVYGTVPTIGNLHITPPTLAPLLAAQSIGFDLGSYQSRLCAVTIALLNHESLSILRTISLSNQAPGHIIAPWDGRADNGMLVSPGHYTVSVTATDTAGNHVTERLLTNVDY